MFGYTRQAYYKRVGQDERQARAAQTARGVVQRVRGRQPYIGTRKLVGFVNAALRASGQRSMGRDTLFDLLRSEGLLIRRRRRGCRTTNSYHRFWRHRNLIRHIRPDRPGQTVVADITYLRTRQGFVYLSLVTDLVSRKILGWDVSSSLAMEGALRALGAAQRALGRTAGVIHHSDRGIQYCCTEYTAALQRAQMVQSATEVDRAAENAVAERLNGILKGELGLGETFADKVSARRAITEAVTIYNWERPHLALNYQTPAAKHAA